MKQSALSKVTRLFLVVAAVGMVLIQFVPLWRIELDAPQYPEGLGLTISPSGLGGDVEIVNGLNHYIGMKTLHNEDFIEFTILPYCLYAFAVLFALSAIANKRMVLNGVVILYLLFCVVSMIDFWRWEYDYGHDLDPNAAIQVPGMAYQPPLIGFKQLLNFGAYSIPDTGGWVFAGVAVFGLLLMLIENKWIIKKVSLPMWLFAPMLLLIQSCTSGPEPIRIGEDQCAFCKMTISDPRFASEIITEKGRVYKFDDLNCAKGYLNENAQNVGDSVQVFVSDFHAPHDLIDYRRAVYYTSSEFKSPMRGNVGAFKDNVSSARIETEMPGWYIQWEEIGR